MHRTKTSQFLEKILHIIFLIVFLVCAFFSLFHFPQYSLLFQHSTIKTLFFACIAAFILFGWEFILKGQTSKATNIIRLSTCIILLLAQVYLFLKVITPVGWDVLEILNSAEYGMYNGDYFAKYPNNLFLQLFLTFYLKITNFIPFLSSLRKFELLNLFFVDSAIFMSVLTTKKIYGQKAADRIFLCAVLLIAFHPTLSVVYSDTLAMPFPIGSLCFFTYGKRADQPLKKTIFFALSAAFGIIGFFIKPTVLIINIAMVIFALLRFRKSYFKSSIIIPILIAVLAGGITYASISSLEQSVENELHAQYPGIKARGVLHYMALGLCKPNATSSGYGSWNEEEVLWMQEHINDSNYTQEAIEHIQSKLIDFGPIGYLQHLANKLIWAGSDGTFFYGGEGEFHLEAQSTQDSLRGKLQNAFYIETDFYQNWLSSWFQGVWLFICIRCIVCYFKRSQDTENGIAKLAILGLFLFLLLFENRSRYLFLYLPVFLFASEYHDNK